MFYINKGEKGYPWLSFDGLRTASIPLLVTLLILAGATVFYIWYSNSSNDVSPDSIAGYGYAIAGTFFMLLAAIRFTMYRRSRKRTVGKMNAFLNWHVCFGIIALALLVMHCFGNFNPRSGTYALYGMIALAVSGAVGKMLDRLMPRLIASEVSKALTPHGEDRIEGISRELRSIVVHNTREEVRTFTTPAAERSVPGIPGLTGLPFGDAADNGSRARRVVTADKKEAPVLQTSWDLAYISLEETPQELSRDTKQYRFVPDPKSPLANPVALVPGAQEQMAALNDVQQALKREERHRYVIRYWRLCHVVLVFVTIGLTVWHLEYATALLIPVLFRH